jgi:hypothetical protein
MRSKVITVLSVFAAVVGWWGLYELTGITNPEDQGALSFFFALLFLAVTATLIPPLAYLNRRFAPKATARDPWRFLRHSAWVGVCITIWGWLQMNRALNLGFVVVTGLIFVAFEILLSRLRGETSSAEGDE